LVLSALFNSLFEFLSPAFLLFKESIGFFLSFSDLFAQYLILSVLELRQMRNLLINKLLSSHLLLLKLLLLFVPSQLFQSFLLLSVIIYLLLILNFLLFLFYLQLSQVIIGFLECLFLLLLLHLPFHFPLFFPFNLVLYLSPNEFPFQLVFLYFLDAAHLI